MATLVGVSLTCLLVEAATSARPSPYVTATTTNCSSAAPRSRVFAINTLQFTAAEGTPTNPFALEAGLMVRFSSSSGATLATPVRGYWDGGHTWRVRFAAPSPGCWTWTTSCLPLSANDSGLCTHTGQLCVLPPQPAEPRELFRRGGWLSTANSSQQQGQHHLTYTDGSPFWWLADTWWTAPSRAVPLVEFVAALKQRRQQGFTAVQVHGSQGFESHINVSRSVQQPFDVTFWQKQDAYYEAAAEQDIMLVVGFSRGDLLSRFEHSVEVLPTIFAYHLARFGAFPISYLVTQEYNCNTYSTRPDIARLVAQGQLLSKFDPYRRALTMHPAVSYLDTQDAWKAQWHPGTFFAMVQQGHLVNNDGVTLGRLRNFSRLARSSGFVLINGEANYEGFVRGWSGGPPPAGWHPSRGLNCSHEVNAACVRDTLYTSLMSGFAGFTYGAQGVYAGIHTTDKTGAGPTEHHGPVLTMAQGLNLLGATQLQHAQSFFQGVVGADYNLLRPCVSCLARADNPCCPPALVTQRGSCDFAVYVKVHSSPCKPIALNISPCNAAVSRWRIVTFNPRLGNKTAALVPATVVREGALHLGPFACEPDLDWLLWVSPELEH